MKSNIFIICLFISWGITSCNNSSTESTKAEVSDSPVVETPIRVVTDDPDPTDSIPGDGYSLNNSSKQTADLIRLTLKDQLKLELEKNLVDSLSRKFIFFEYDLNDDGKKEIFVGLTGPFFCGSGGCTVYLLDNQGNVITKFSVSRDIAIDTKTTNGYKDLFIYSGGKFRIVKFDGKKYPSNPSTLPALKDIPGDDLTRALNSRYEPYPWFTF